MDLLLFFNVFLLVFVVTTIWDVSGIVSDMSRWLYEFAKPGKIWMGQPLPKPFGCSYCIKFHAVWIYLIVFNGVGIIVGLSVASLFTFIGVGLKGLLVKLNDLLNRI